MKSVINFVAIPSWAAGIQWIYITLSVNNVISNTTCNWIMQNTPFCSASTVHYRKQWNNPSDINGLAKLEISHTNDLDQDWLQLFEHQMSAAEREHHDDDDYDEPDLWMSSMVDVDQDLLDHCDQ